MTTPTTTRIRFLAARAKKARRPAPARAIFHVRASARCITYNPADQPRPHNKPRGGRPPTKIGANPEKGGATIACTDKRSRSEARNLLPNAEATRPPPPTRHPVPVATWLAKNKHHNLGCIQRHELGWPTPVSILSSGASRRSGPTLCGEVWLLAARAGTVGVDAPCPHIGKMQDMTAHRAIGA